MSQIKTKTVVSRTVVATATCDRCGKDIKSERPSNRGVDLWDAADVTLTARGASEKKVNPMDYGERNQTTYIGLICFRCIADVINFVWAAAKAKST